MKAVTSTVLGSILVLLLIHFTSAKDAEVHLTNPPTEGRLVCNPGYHIVVKKGTLYHNGRKLDENARYAPKMACDLEQSCNFKFTRQTLSYMSTAIHEGTQLTINYDCKRDNFQGDPRRITDYTKTQGCPQDSFVQKHVAYFNDENIAPKRDNPVAQREREMIAMGVCAQVKRFRQNNPRTPIDPHLGTVYLIYDNRTSKNDFMPSSDPRKCQLKDSALAKTYKYNCERKVDKWTCTFAGKGGDLAIHDKVTSHLE